jgi:hypothetical protein
VKIWGQIRIPHQILSYLGQKKYIGPFATFYIRPKNQKKLLIGSKRREQPNIWAQIRRARKILTYVATKISQIRPLLAVPEGKQVSDI